MRFTPGGQAVANFRIATNESWTDKNQQKQERTEWHRIVVWGKLAELCGEYLKKGRQAYVEGRLQTREWTDKEGKKNYTTEIVANTVELRWVVVRGERAAAVATSAVEAVGGRAEEEMTLAAAEVVVQSRWGRWARLQVGMTFPSEAT